MTLNFTSNMRRFNINSKKTYTKDGAEKTVWLPVGTLTEFKDGEFGIELNFLPDTKLYTFEQKPKEQGTQSSDLPF